MTLLIDSTVKVALIVLLALGGALLLRRSAAAIRHYLLTVAIVCAIVTPMLALMLPSQPIAMPALAPLARTRALVPAVTFTIMPQDLPRRGGQADEPAGSSAVESAPVAPRILAGVWLTGMLLALSFLVVGLMRLRRIAADARPLDGGPWIRHTEEIVQAAGVRRPVVLLQSEHPTLLVTWGWRRAKIILPAAARGWSDDRVRVVVAHELAHIRRGDWAAQMLGELLRAIYWFNPLIWIACRRLRLESEHACDDAVLQSGVDPTDYASHLLDLARTLNTGHRVRVPAPAMARASSLEGRISAMLNSRLDRRPLTARMQTVIAITLFTATVGIASAAAQARFSTFSGTVVDETNSFLPDTTVALTNNANQARYEVHSDRTGRFEFVGLPAGDYTLQISQPGFASLSEPISIAGRDLTRTMQLQLGSLQETITLLAGPAKPAAPDPARAEKLQAVREKARERQQRIAERCAAGTGGMGGNILQPLKIVDVKPIYPEQLTSAGVGGVVTMEALIGSDGTVRDVRVISSPHPDLDRAALDAVRQWEFTPTILNCTPVDVRMKVTANFVVRD